MIVLIVFIVCASKIYRTRFQARHGIIENRDGAQQFFDRPDDGKSKADLHRELDGLRERIKVLERIATDANTLEGRQTRAIAAEIESLRDK